MNNLKIIRRARLGTALAAVALSLGAVGAATPAAAASHSARPAETLNLSQGTGTLVRLSEPMTDVFVANDGIADVQVRSASQLYIFGKTRGETTIYATSKSGRVVYAANVRVGKNISSLDEMLHLAMPDANITATPMNNLVLLTGTVASPDDAETAERLITNYLGNDASYGVVNRLRTATPLQVMLKVRISEVNRSLLKKVGVNLLSSDSTGGFKFGVAQGSVSSGNVSPFSVGALASGGTTLGAAGKLLGLDLSAALDLAQTDGLVTTLAEPTLTALSGETASFLAGGEFPIPISQGNDSISIEYKQYGVGLAFTPVVLADGRISMRVRPEVSELSDSGSIKLNGYDVPALTTRRAETTVELGSGQSFMIAGLLQNKNRNSLTKAPFLGDVPILGMLFRSTSYQRDETELVIIVTPYLVKPVSGQLAIPADGYRAPTDTQITVEGQSYTGRSGPSAVVPSAAPAISGGAAAAVPGFKL